MADTSIQTKVAEWICDHFLPERFGGRFDRQRVQLSSGGTHSFAAVSDDGASVGTICTGAAATSGGKLAVEKLNKVRADLYFLLLAEGQRKFIVTVQPIMHRLLLAERDEYRRIPDSVEIIRATLPPHLARQLESSQHAASSEVSPIRYELQ